MAGLEPEHLVAAVSELREIVCGNDVVADDAVREGSVRHLEHDRVVQPDRVDAREGREIRRPVTGHVDQLPFAGKSRGTVATRPFPQCLLVRPFHDDHVQPDPRDQEPADGAAVLQAPAVRASLRSEGAMGLRRGSTRREPHVEPHYSVLVRAGKPLLLRMRVQRRERVLPLPHHDYPDQHDRTGRDEDESGETPSTDHQYVSLRSSSAAGVPGKAISDGPQPDPANAYPEVVAATGSQPQEGITLRGRRQQAAPLVVLALALTLSVIAANSLAQPGGHVPKTLLLPAILAGTTIMLVLDQRHLFLGWLFLAPLLQESASNSRAGHLLALGLYTAPPLILLVKHLAMRGARPRAEWVDVLPGAFALLLLASLVLTAWSAMRSQTSGELRTYYQNVALGPLVYYLVGFWRGPLAVASIVKVLLAATFLQSAMAIVEWRTGWNLWHDLTWARAGDVRAISTLGNPAITGAFVGVGVVLALGVLIWNGPWQLRTYAVWNLILALPALYATKTRGPMLATAITVTLVLLASNRTRLLGITGGILVGLLLYAYWPVIQNSGFYRSRLAEKQNVQARVVLQDVSIKLAEKRPLLGWGYASFDRAKFHVSVSSPTLPLDQALKSTSHDTYLTILVEYGGIGLALFLVPLALILLRGIRQARAPSASDRWLVVGLIAAIGVILINGATLDYTLYSFITVLAWLLLGLLRRTTAAPQIPS
jgi:O-antigen ligase